MSELRNNEGIRREGLTVLHNPHDAVLESVAQVPTHTQ